MRYIKIYKTYFPGERKDFVLKSGDSVTKSKMAILAT